MKQSTRWARQLILVAGLGLASTGCSFVSGIFGGLKVNEVSTAYQQPSNVAVYFTVEEGQEPITDLDAGDVRIFENDQDVTDAAQAQFLPVDVVAAHHALMLIDLSGPASEKPKLAAATKTMIEKVTPAMGVTVYGYDGRAELQLIGDFPKGTPAPDIDPTLLASNDPSRNLHGAIMLGLQELDARLMQQQKPVRRGNLVVLLRGPDIAGRSTLQQAQKAIERTGYNSYAVVLGQPEGVSGDEIGKTKAVDGVAGLNAAMEQAANLVVGGKMREYVLSYCSPARAGKRTVRLEVTLPPKTEDDSEKRGRLETEIDATGFAGGCDSSQPPRFVVGAAPPTEPSEAEGEPPPEEQPPSPAPSAPTTPAAPPAGQGDGEEGGDIVPPPDKPGYAPQDD